MASSDEVTNNIIASLAEVRIGQTETNSETQPGQVDDNAISSTSSPQNMQNVGNVTFSCARRALTFGCDEEQASSSSGRGTESPATNREL